MAAELREAFPDAALTLTPSAGGVFEVVVDGRKLFSKKALGRHAEPGEILLSLREASKGN